MSSHWTPWRVTQFGNTCFCGMSQQGRPGYWTFNLIYELGQRAQCFWERTKASWTGSLKGQEVTESVPGPERKQTEGQSWRRGKQSCGLISSHHCSPAQRWRPVVRTSRNDSERQTGKAHVFYWEWTAITSRGSSCYKQVDFILGFTKQLQAPSNDQSLTP